METPGVSLTDEEVRERFSAYLEGELPADEAAAVKQRLADDASLRTDYERFRTLLGGLATMGLDDADIAPDVARISLPPDDPRPDRASQIPRASAPPGSHKAEPVNLLDGVQAKLHKRSRGKFYRNRYARRAGLMPLEWIAAVVLILLVLAWAATTFITETRPARPVPTAPGPTGR